ncbi:MAG TPA: GNAT family N-acetyltransferase [Micromonosporaceae bacterium]|nr:GNAT family N-acetyltransferase [Micromonosporaceae bacterium]
MTSIRAYRPVDHSACRELWAELTMHHRELYDDPTFGGADPGAAFEEYLTRLDLSGIWVADHPEDGVVGMVGLLLKGRAGEVEPVVVAEHRRGQGIGRALLDQVAGEARRRGMAYLTVTPASRNEPAVRCLYRAGYDVLSNVTLTLDIGRRSHEWRDGMDLFDLRLRY